MELVKVTRGGQSWIVEKHKDATVTLWGYSVWGAIGQTADISIFDTMQPLTTKEDKREAERITKMMERCDKMQSALYAGIKLAQ